MLWCYRRRLSHKVRPVTRLTATSLGYMQIKAICNTTSGFTVYTACYRYRDRTCLFLATSETKVSVIFFLKISLCFPTYGRSQSHQDRFTLKFKDTFITQVLRIRNRKSLAEITGYGVAWTKWNYKFILVTKTRFTKKPQKPRCGTWRVNQQLRGKKSATDNHDPSFNLWLEIQNLGTKRRLRGSSEKD